MKKKILLLLPLLVSIVVVIWYGSATQWTRDFDLKYVDYANVWETDNGDSYEIYEITNNTERTLKNVYVVILIEDVILEREWKIEDKVASSIKPGETVVYELHRKNCKKALEKLGADPLYFNEEIVKIKYSR